MTQACIPGDIKRIAGQGQPGTKSLQVSIFNQYKLGMVTHASHPSFMRSVNRRILVQVSLGINVRPYPKITKAKRARTIAQVLEHMPSKYKTQVQIQVLPKKKKKRKFKQ
jgi:hypothetical protein